MSIAPLPLPCDEFPAAAAGVGASYAHCRALVRASATSFYHSMRLIPEPQRSATYALYSWMRVADDLADEPAGALTADADACADARARSLHRFWDETRAHLRDGAAGRHELTAPRRGEDAPSSTLWPAFRDSCVRYRLPQALLADFVSGQVLDLRKTRYATFDELYDYCFKVASVVGLLCVEVWGYSGGAETRRLAEWRGIAFQLTNIARDVREDALRGRVYVPADLTGGRCLSPESFLCGGRDAAGAADGRRAVEAVCRLARSYYEASAALDGRVGAPGRACLRAMTETYRALLDKVARDPGAVLREGRVRLGAVRKVWIALRAVRG